MIGLLALDQRGILKGSVDSSHRNICERVVSYMPKRAFGTCFRACKRDRGIARAFGACFSVQITGPGVSNMLVARALTYDVLSHAPGTSFPGRGSRSDPIRSDFRIYPISR